MKNLKVRTKLIGSFITILILFAVSIIVSLSTLGSLGGEVDNFYNNPYAVKDSANTIKNNFQGMLRYAYRAILSEDDQNINESIGQAAGCAEELLKAVPLIVDKFNGDQQLVTNLTSDLETLQNYSQQLFDLALAHKDEEASELLETSILPVADSAMVSLNGIIDYVNEKGGSLLTDIGAEQNTAFFSLLIMGLVGVAISITLCFVIIKGITRPLGELKRAAGEMAIGNMKTEIRYRSKDELGQVSDALRQTIGVLDGYIVDIGRGMALMAAGDLTVKPEVEFSGDFIKLRDSIVGVVKSFNRILVNINRAADQVTEGSDQLASSAQVLGQGATEQAASIQELAATIERISRDVESNAKNSADVTTEVRGVGEEMDHSNVKMKQMIAAMQEISVNSDKIGKIIKTIEDIAFQTNILALNAAVEAARAGSAGKGFAVVADEVRSLANKSAAASQNTTDLIEESIRAVENGSRIADETAKTLELAAEGTKRVITIIDQISQASMGQAESIGQVTDGFGQISAVVQTNAATSEECAASSEELSAQAQLLKSLVGQFKISAGMEAPQENATVTAREPVSMISLSGDKY